MQWPKRPLVATLAAVLAVAAIATEHLLASPSEEAHSVIGPGRMARLHATSGGGQSGTAARQADLSIPGVFGHPLSTAGIVLSPPQSAPAINQSAAQGGGYTNVSTVLCRAGRSRRHVEHPPPVSRCQGALLDRFNEPLRHSGCAFRPGSGVPELATSLLPCRVRRRRDGSSVEAMAGSMP